MVCGVSNPTKGCLTPLPCTGIAPQHQAALASVLSYLPEVRKAPEPHIIIFHHFQPLFLHFKDHSRSNNVADFPARAD